MTASISSTTAGLNQAPPRIAPSVRACASVSVTDAVVRPRGSMT